MKINYETVQTKNDLVVFLRALRHDLNTHPNEWENLTLEMFLEAMESWTEDTDSLPASPEWKSFANILLAGKLYE